MNGPNKLDCFITLSWKALSGISNLAYLAQSKVRAVNTIPDNFRTFFTIFDANLYLMLQ